MELSEVIQLKNLYSPQKNHQIFEYGITLKFDQIELYDKLNLSQIILPKSGGSGGGGAGSSISLSYDVRYGAFAGTPFDINNSIITTGDNSTTISGGNGGNINFTDPISGLIVGKGGIGAGTNTTPVIKTTYGSGGDGNGGLGFNGVIIIKVIKYYLINYLENVEWNKILNHNISVPLIVNQNNIVIVNRVRQKKNAYLIFNLIYIITFLCRSSKWAKLYWFY